MDQSINNGLTDSFFNMFPSDIKDEPFDFNETRGLSEGGNAQVGQHPPNEGGEEQHQQSVNSFLREFAADSNTWDDSSNSMQQ